MTKHKKRCVLPVPFRYRKGCFGWGIWVEVDQAHHDECLRHFHAGAKAAAPFSGPIANDLRLYPGTLGLEVSVSPADEHRPYVVSPPDSTHRLAVEQRRGIGPKRHHEIVEPSSP